MSAQLIDGKSISADIRNELKHRIADLNKRGVIPGLGVILVGDDPASKSYVAAKERACESIGIYSDDNRYSSKITEKDLLDKIESLNNDPKIHGILVQLPLPSHINSTLVLNAITPDKDVDGFHPVNVGKMMIGEDSFLPCTPHGIIQLLRRCNIETRGKHAVVIGRSNIVGKPIANMLFQKNMDTNATVTICHTSTNNLKDFTRNADIIIAASGQPNTLTSDMVKPGVVIIDVGVNRVEDLSKKNGFRLVGDVDFNGLFDIASAITPVPGGVGPMTITMLLYNTVKSAEKLIERNVQ
ncbi:MAG: bifunctional methylenetetrahydrofolate dehydrogenase/methenyltetrahydrofolate cyclohydrolase FolD [Verrucomicrobiota bacterium]|nr:bifunctional methylenetetrahydrofolate dehydrogenase/methenyltetrahydrofolate cyclohydrolase FolD [Verrucomicrobiota bacterium]MEC7907972.1 bifunctional methylenetetrahydrofolate dehydrogenase/methenyltetrahydrofolate cyclohydrolase FolD [Verrucomicrobiota bacterium]MEC8313751.1 bifunctional methylenetetrahydrofolate dehydrogenase/methenyltetrahydrofolate cyclohydrolase FolD [Verrucomicrobiota bacterium]MEC8517810.1 bifunctional methylenetetrahydrofolate dehydrogenase/methenyltetrahydrofolate